MPSVRPDHATRDVQDEMFRSSVLKVEGEWFQLATGEPEGFWVRADESGTEE